MKISYLLLKLVFLGLSLAACSLKQSDSLPLQTSVDKSQENQPEIQQVSWSVLKIDRNFLTFSNIKEQVIIPKCLKCHKSYSEYQNVYEIKEKIYVRSILKQDMPKISSKIHLSDFEGNLLKQWIEIGAPVDEVTPVVVLPPTAGNPSQFERPVVWETIKTKILDKHCASCHFKGNADQISSYEDYQTVKNTIGTIYGLTAIKPFMPPPDTELNEGDINPNQMTTAEKDLLSAWINDGLLEKKN